MSASDDQFEKLLDEVERLRAANVSLPSAADLAARHGLDEDAVRDVLAGLDAMGEFVSGGDVAGVPPDLGDDYELGSELGRGGMGIVYRAHQRSLDRDVAVKVLRPGQLLFGEALERFDRETRALAKLRHPNIAAIHEVGRTDGELFFTMDLIEGGTLADLLKAQRRPLPVAFAVELMRKVADAIAFVHRHGLVHRDLKPANVLLDADQTPYVVDFGLAIDAAGGHTLTATGRLLGTPAYMAPEQAAGKRALVTERTDIYALGVMLYELISGRPPFEGRSLVDTIHAVVHEEPPRPRALRKDLPRALETIVMRAMEKDPSRRYGTAEAFSADLDRFAKGEPLATHAPGLAAPLGRLVRRHRSALSGVLIGAAAMMAVFFGAGRTDGDDGAGERLALVRRLQDAGQWRGALQVAAEAREGLDTGDTLSEEQAALAFEIQVADLAALDERYGAGSIPAGELDGFASEIEGLERRGGLVHHLRALRHGLAERRLGMQRLWTVDVLDEPVETPLESGPFAPGRPFGWFAQVQDPRLGFLPLTKAAGHPLEAYLALRDQSQQRGLLHKNRDRRTAGRIAAILVPRLGGDRVAHLLIPELTAAPLVLSGFDVPMARADLEKLRDLALDPASPIGQRVDALETVLLLHGGPRLGMSLRYEGDRYPEEPGAQDPMPAETFFGSGAAATVFEGLMSSRDRGESERRVAEAEAILALVSQLGDSASFTFTREVSSWFEARFGARIPKGPPAIDAWWVELREQGPLASIEAALDRGGVPVPGTPAEALALLEEARSGMRRLVHEWLVVNSDVDGAERPWWPYSSADSRGSGVFPASVVAALWRRAIEGDEGTGDVPLELAVVHWPGGLGAPRVVARCTVPTGVEGGMVEVPIHDLVLTGPRDRATTWEQLGRRKQEIPGRSRNECVLIAKADRVVDRFGQAFEVSASIEVGSRGSRIPAVDQGVVAHPRPGDVRVIADLMERHLGVDGVRFAVLAFARTGRGVPVPETVEEWTLALASSVESDVAKATGARDVPFEARNLECLARLVHDLGANGEIGSAARSLLDALQRFWGGPQGLGSLRHVAAAESLQIVLGEEPGGALRARIDGAWDLEQLPMLAERLALDPRADVRRAARRSLAKGYRDATHAELVEIDRLEPVGQPLSSQLDAHGRRSTLRWTRHGFALLTLALLGLAMLLSGRGAALVGWGWAALSVVLGLSGFEESQEGLWLVPLLGFIVIAAARSAAMFPAGGLCLTASLVATAIADACAHRAAADAAAMGFAAIGFLVHALGARHAEARGAHVPGARLALFAAVPCLGLALAAACEALGIQQSLILTRGWITPGALFAALVAIGILLLRELLLGPGSQPLRRRTTGRGIGEPVPSDSQDSVRGA